MTSPTPRIFKLIRGEDITGVSGTGHVADGVLWSDGTATVRWRGEHPSTVSWDRGQVSIQHVHGHGGATKVVFDETGDYLAAIARAHTQEIGQGGRTSGECVECGCPYPCPTFLWATGERQADDCWDPADDEPEEATR